jgi:hypothetical protein
VWRGGWVAFNLATSVAQRLLRSSLTASTLINIEKNCQDDGLAVAKAV